MTHAKTLHIPLLAANRGPAVKRRLATALAAGLFLVAAALLLSGEPAVLPAQRPPPTKDYVGALTCKGCHPKEYAIWAGSKHSRSFVALQTARARLVSGEPNAYAGMPSEKMMKECSPCHARGMDIPRRERQKDFHPEDGVQCEACHGPGGHYANESTMKDEAKRTEAGLRKPTVEQCLECHKEKPTHAVLGKPPFDFNVSWAKIAHGVKPGEKRATY